LYVWPGGLLGRGGRHQYCQSEVRREGHVGKEKFRLCRIRASAHERNLVRGYRQARIPAHVLREAETNGWRVSPSRESVQFTAPRKALAIVLVKASSAMVRAATRAASLAREQLVDLHRRGPQRRPPAANNISTVATTTPIGARQVT